MSPTGPCVWIAGTHWSSCLGTWRAWLVKAGHQDRLLRATYIPALFPVLLSTSWFNKMWTCGSGNPRGHSPGCPGHHNDGLHPLRWKPQPATPWWASGCATTIKSIDSLLSSLPRPFIFLGSPLEQAGNLFIKASHSFHATENNLYIKDGFDKSTIEKSRNENVANKGMERKILAHWLVHDSRRTWIGKN